MLEGLNSAAAGMAAQQQRIDALANDLANVSTTGYKRVRVSFRDLVYNPAGGGAADGVVTGAGVAASDAGRSFAAGDVRDTGRQLDVALSGSGFLRVGDALTRDGALQLDSAGRLTAGGRVLEPAITIPPGTDEAEIEIARDGSVAVKGKTLGKLPIVSVPSPNGLISRGDNLFTASAASGAPRADATTTVTQGALEAANVDMATAMTDMIEAQRSYELASRAIQQQDQMMEIANGVRR